MGYIVTCPQCNEVNSGGQIYCTKCQASLIGIPRQEQLSPEPLTPTPPNPPAESKPIIIPPQYKKSSPSIWMIAGIVIGVLCLGAVICLATSAITLNKVESEREPVEAVLDTYMKHMMNKDVESAYVLFAPRAQRQIPISKVQELIEGNNYVIYEGYKDLSVENINLTASANTNPDLPQGNVARVNGIINYENGVQGTFKATLEKIDGKWLLDGVYVTVPPEKFSP